MHHVVGILLAAGRGRRFDPEGRQDKLLVSLDAGQSVLLQSALHLRAWVDRLIIITRPGRAAMFQASCQGLEAEWVEAQEADLGMGASLKAGVSASPLPLTGWLIGLADMPWIHAQTYQQVRQSLETGCDLARPCHQGRPGHPVGCSSRVADAVMSLRAAAGLGQLFQGSTLNIQQLDVNDPGCTRDIDLPADLD